ncbi:MAG TPA: ATP-binding protein [bacterium]|jgi:serine/threonine-protein kinase RsbW|nr:ATP-binding protein [bacterium]
MLTHRLRNTIDERLVPRRRVVRVNPESTGSEAQTSPERVAMTIPSRAEYVGVVRLAAAAIAGRMAFGYDEVEDLKVAVSEACSEAILNGGSEVEIQFAVGPDRLEVQVAGGVGQAERGQESELGLLLMRVLMDEVRTEREGARQILRLVKRLSK